MTKLRTISRLVLYCFICIKYSNKLQLHELRKHFLHDVSYVKQLPVLEEFSQLAPERSCAVEGLQNVRSSY